MAHECTVSAQRTSTNQLVRAMSIRHSLPATSTRRSVLAFRALVIVAGLLACSGGASDSVSPAGAGTVPAAIAITPSAPTVTLGSQIALQAQVQDAAGQPIPGATVFWSSNDTSVATVSSAGVVTGKNIGNAQVAASSGGRSAVVAISVLPVSVASVAVLPTTASLTIGGTVTLHAATYDAANHEITGRSVVWASDAPQVASVDASGTVTAVAAGTAQVSATSEGKSASANITVTVIPVASVAVVPGSAALTVGESASLSAVTTDANGNVLSGRAITWSSANSGIAKVSSLGLVTAVGAGTTTITATSEGKSGSAQVVVTAPPPPEPVASVAVNPPTASLAIGGTITLSATVRDAHGAALSGRTITWSTSAAQIATVSNTGVVTAVAPGVATITATSEGKSGASIVTVQPPAPAPVASVVIDPAFLTLHNDHARTLTAQVLDANGNVLTGRTITWSSSNDAILKVEQTGPSTASVRFIGDGSGAGTVTATCEGVTGTAVITYSN
jgi:trimeric autotransporter adhesin